MGKTQVRKPRRGESLSRAQIVHASVELLDRHGEDGLTFRTLAERLSTGAGAIYGHISNKNDLLTAACDAVVTKTLEGCTAQTSPEAAIQAIALSLFDAFDAHPWAGSALARAEIHTPAVRILERVGQQVRAMGVSREREWPTASALMNYIVGVAAQNASHGRHAGEQRLNRTEFLGSTARAWLQLDEGEHPFAHRVAKQFEAHDDRADFLFGINLLLTGIHTTK